MEHTIRWKKMKYGTSKRSIESSLAVLFIYLLATMGEQAM